MKIKILIIIFIITKTCFGQINSLNTILNIKSKPSYDKLKYTALNSNYCFLSSTNDDSVNLGTGDFSIALQIKGATINQGFLGKWGISPMWWIGTSVAAKFYARFRNSTGAGDSQGSALTVLDNSTSYFLVISGTRGDSARFYVNGSADGGFVLHELTLDNSIDFIVGSQTTTSLPFNGTIDNIGIWGSALGASEVVSLYNSGNVLDYSSNSDNYISSSNLKVYWKFNEGSGQFARDDIANTDLQLGSKSYIDINDPDWSN